MADKTNQPLIYARLDATVRLEDATDEYAIVSGSDEVLSVGPDVHLRLHQLIWKKVRGWTGQRVADVPTHGGLVKYEFRRLLGKLASPLTFSPDGRVLLGDNRVQLASTVDALTSRT